MVTERRSRHTEAVLRHRLNGLTVICENFANPYNAAAVLRTCEAMGVLNVYIVEEHGPCEVSKQVTAGAERWLRIHRYRRVQAALTDLRASGHRIYAATPEQGTLELEEIPCAAPLALVFGNEREGVTSEALAQADGTFTIPMHGFVRSLNVSAAASISVYHCSRRLRDERGPGDLSPQEAEALRSAYLEGSQGAT